MISKDKDDKFETTCSRFWKIGCRIDNISNLTLDSHDVVNDPGEKHNLYFEHPEVVKELWSLLDKIKHQGYSRPIVNMKQHEAKK